MILLLDNSRGLARHEIVPSSWPRESLRKKKKHCAGGILSGVKNRENFDEKYN